MHQSFPADCTMLASYSTSECILLSPDFYIFQTAQPGRSCCFKIFVFHGTSFPVVYEIRSCNRNQILRSSCWHFSPTQLVSSVGGSHTKLKCLNFAVNSVLFPLAWWFAVFYLVQGNGCGILCGEMDQRLSLFPMEKVAAWFLVLTWSKKLQNRKATIFISKCESFIPSILISQYSYRSRRTMCNKRIHASSLLGANAGRCRWLLYGPSMLGSWVIPFNLHLQ